MDINVYGDSKVAGTWLDHPERDAWPRRLDERIGGDGCGRVLNCGVGGQTVDKYPDQQHPDTESLRDLATRVAALVPKPRVVILSSGCNDLIRVTDTGPLRWAMFHIFYDVQALGVDVFWTTITPYGHGTVNPDGWLPALEGRRGPVNAWMLAQFGDHLINLDPALATSQTFTYNGTTYTLPLLDPRYSIDGLHFNPWGALRVADAMPLAQILAGN